MYIYIYTCVYIYIYTYVHVYIDISLYVPPAILAAGIAVPIVTLGL